MSTPASLPPFEVRTTPDGVVVERPVLTGDKLLRRVQRFLVVCLIALAGGVTWMATLVPGAANTVIAAMFALVCLAGAGLVAWWMGTLGARHITRAGDTVTVGLVGAGGFERTRTLPRAACRRLVGVEATRRGRTAMVRGYTLTLDTDQGPLRLGFMPRGAEGRGPAALAALIGVPFEVGR